MRVFAAVPGKPLQRFHIAANKRFLLRSTPTLYLPLSRNSVGNALTFLRKDQIDRTSGFRIATVGTRIVLCNAPFQASAR